MCFHIQNGDDLIGTWTFDYADLKEMEAVVPDDAEGDELVIISPTYYVHFYGAPIGYQR